MPSDAVGGVEFAHRVVSGHEFLGRNPERVGELSEDLDRRDLLQGLDLGNAESRNGGGTKGA